MASHAKRAHLDPTPDIPEQTKNLIENDYESEDESNYMERETQVEARTGVISRLKQYFHGSEDVNHGALAQCVLKQKSVGSVVTQSPSDSTDDEDVDELGKKKYDNIGTFERMIIEKICSSGQLRFA